MFLCQPGRIKDAFGSGNFRKRYFSNLGQLATADPQAWGSCLSLRTTLPALVRREWEDVLALEMLLLAQAQPDVAKPVLRELADVQPLGPGTPPVKELQDKLLSMALVPLMTPKGTVGDLALICSIRGLGRVRAPSSLDVAQSPSLCEQKQEGDSVFYLTERGEALPAGDSWQLAAYSALRSLREPPATRLDLASNWILTGSIDSHGRVDRVYLGNKLGLASLLPARKWMLPGANYNPSDSKLGVFCGVTAGRHYWASDADTAWNIFTSQRTVDDDSNQPWPLDVGAMHCLVSDALAPMLAAFIIAHPAEAVLWCSSKMKAQGALLGKGIEVAHKIGILPHLPHIRYVPAPSKKISDAETAIASDLGGSQTMETFFNITGGNLLMRLAVTNLARMNPAVRLLYRDYDAGRTEFTQLHYPMGQASTSRFTVDEDHYPFDIAKLIATSAYNKDKMLDGADARLRSLILAIFPETRRND